MLGLSKEVQAESKSTVEESYTKICNTGLWDYLVGCVGAKSVEIVKILLISCEVLRAQVGDKTFVKQTRRESYTCQQNHVFFLSSRMV